MSTEFNDKFSEYNALFLKHNEKHFIKMLKVFIEMFVKKLQNNNLVKYSIQDTGVFEMAGDNEFDE